MIDRLRKRPIVWISAPAGSGKTTLVVSYLQARELPAIWYQADAGDGDVASFFYYLGLAAKAIAPRYRKPLPLLSPEQMSESAAFTLVYFRELFARLKRPSALVIDNYQDIPPDSAVHHVLRYAAKEIPSQITLIIVSREEPPGTLARLRVSGEIALLGWDQLKLTAKESADIVGLRHKGEALSSTAIANLHQETQGWVAGLVLLTEQAQPNVGGQIHRDEFASQSLFDYFASEIFLRSSPSVREFLLKTAFLPKMSATLARAFTDEAGSEWILRDLTRRNYFTVKHAEGSYEYHPLFRAFLMSRAQAVYTNEQLRRLESSAAELLAEHGDVEAAVGLLQDAKDWPSALRLVLAHARMLRSQGRTQTLEKWLRRFPESFRNQNPWALYWLGICRLPFAPAEARPYFESAFALFEREHQSTPLYLAWSRIIDSFLLELDDLTPMLKWLERYPHLKGDRLPPNRGVENAAVFTYVAGLTNARFDHPDLPIYVEHAERLFFNETDTDRQLAQGATLIPYYLWSGDLTKVTNLLDRLTPPARASEASALARINWYMWKSMEAAMTGAADDCLQATNDGLTLADTSGIHSLDLYLFGYGILGRLSAGNIAEARELAQRMLRTPRQGMIKNAIYSHFMSMVALHEGDIARAVDEARLATDLAKRSGLVIGVMAYGLGLAYAHVASGNAESAQRVLTDIRSRVDKAPNSSFECYFALCEAIVGQMRGEEVLARQSLARALSVAQSRGFVTPSYCPRDAAALIYAMGLDADIHADYIRAIITRTRLPPPPGLLSERWPWKIRLYTFGRFAVIKDGAPLTFSGKAHKKPFELLRALVALGGRNVGAAKLAQMLWPDALGDVAIHTLETTLYRLRKLLDEKSLVTHDGQLSLNPGCCWLDLWTFERLADSTETRLSPAKRAARLIELYRGQFLEDDDTAWAFAQRERSRSKFVRTVVQLGETLETQELRQEAIDLYQKGIEIDPLAEELYRRLMLMYRRLQRPAEALAVYRRCQAMLASVLHAQPAQDLKTLQAEIQRDAAQDGTPSRGGNFG